MNKILNTTQMPKTIDLYKLVILYLISDLFSFLCKFLKAYRIICYARILFDQLPYFANPYEWPFNFIRIVTTPFFEYFSKKIPLIRYGKYNYDASTVICLEILNSLIPFLNNIQSLIFIKATNFEIFYNLSY